MSNVCYTKYKIEGPEKEILSLYHRLQEMMTLKAKLDAGEKESERQFERRVEKYGPEYLLTGAYTIVSPLNLHCLQELNNGWLVMTVVAGSQWTPAFYIWDSLLERFAPHAHYIYFTEEFWAGTVETNDIWGKYFDYQYAVAAKFPEGTPENLKKAFANTTDPYSFYPVAEYREYDDEYQMYVSYWPQRNLRRALLELLPAKKWLVPSYRLYTSELICRFEEWLSNEVNMSKTILIIRKVKHPRPQAERPCSHCERILYLERELMKAEERNEKLASTLRHCFYKRHEQK